MSYERIYSAVYWIEKNMPAMRPCAIFFPFRGGLNRIGLKGQIRL